MRCFCLSIHILFVSISFSQNWNLIDADKTYFFKHLDSLYITNTIKVDSTVTSGVDTDFHVHTTIKVCDTCTVIPPEALNGVLYHAYWPEIFGLSPSYSSTTNAFIFQDGTIKHHAEILDSWVFNTTSGITAAVVDKYEITLFGQPDSVKIIELSTLDTILISKNHGVIRYPDFENSGKYFLQVGYHEGQNSYGEYLPNMWRIYDFEVGDVFCLNYHHSEINLGMYSYGASTKIIIYNDFSSPTNRTYYCHALSNYIEEDDFGTFIHETYNTWGYLDINDSYAYYENNYSGLVPTYDQLLDMGVDNFWGYFENTQVNYFLWPEYAFIMTHRFDTDYGYVKNISTVIYYTDSLLFQETTSTESYQLEFAEGVGRFLLDVTMFEYHDDEGLKGYVKNGDTTGIIYDFPEDLGTDKSIPVEYVIYPNPATNQINIPANLSLISIYSVSGQLILQHENPGQIISIENLPEGIYFVNMIDQNNHHLFSKLLVE